MWSLYAAIAMLCFAGMQLLFKQLTRLGLSPAVILAYVFAFGTLFFAVHLGVTREPIAASGRAVALLVGATLLSYAGNLYMLRSLGSAPNPGYAIAIVGVQALVIAIAAIPLFGAEFTWLKGLGVALSVAGVALLAL